MMGIIQTAQIVVTLHFSLLILHCIT